MIVAALAAAVTSYGACSYAPQKETAWVYHWKFTGKTTTPNKVKLAKSYSSCSVAPTTCAVRVPSSFKIEGYAYYCSPGCGDQFTELAEVNEVFWMRKPVKDDLAGGVATEIMHIIGKKAKQGEVFGTATFNGATRNIKFNYAGLGKYDTKHRRLSSASGNFAGTATFCECAPATYWDCDSLSLLCEENAPTVVYGKWSVKFKKSAARKYLKNGSTVKVPAWVSWKNQD